MKSFDELGIVIDYIEKNILDVNYDTISKLIGIPIGLYQRIFSYLCGISISEYIRKRKLTLAAKDILLGSGSIIEIALKYGYEAHSAFSRAFKEQFHIPPSELTYDIFQNYAFTGLPFHNETYLIVKGKRIMSSLERIEYVKMPTRKLIGISSLETGRVGRELWDYYFEKGIDKTLETLHTYECKDMEDYIGIGYARNFDETGRSWEYTVGRYFHIDAPVPNGLVSIPIAEGNIAQAQIKGKDIDEIVENAYILTTDMIQKNGFTVNYDKFYWSEVYTYSRFCNPLNNGASEVICDWFIPCK